MRRRSVFAPIEAWDATLHRLLAPVGSLLCRLTGMGNINLGSVTCKVGCFGAIIAEVASCVQRFSVLRAFSVLGWLAIMRILWDVASKLKHGQDAGETVVSIRFEDWVVIVLVRSVLCVVGIMGFVLGEMEASLGALPIIGGSESFTDAEAFRAVMELLLMVGAYLLTNYNPKGLSMVRRLARLLKTSRLPGRAPVTSAT